MSSPPVPLKLRPDLDCPIPPQVPSDLPVQLVHQHPFIQRFDVQPIRKVGARFEKHELQHAVDDYRRRNSKARVQTVDDEVERRSGQLETNLLR